MERQGIPTVVIATEPFVQFARRMAATQGCPYMAIAETPNPVRGLDPEALCARVDAMLPAIVAGLVLAPAEIERRARAAAQGETRPVRASVPV
ncbi:MAG TPA: hypothetical protein VKF40_02670 [Burkholderiales bacterium]|nr:hypothetical protein [Burkholderiales bacterium]